MQEKKNINDFLAKNAIKDNSWKKEASNRIINEDWLDDSFTIALNILRILREKKHTQDWLSQELKLTPQYINKIVKGDVNLSLKTISKIGKVLGYKLINVPVYETSEVSAENYESDIAKKYPTMSLSYTNKNLKRQATRGIYSKISEDLKVIKEKQAI